MAKLVINPKASEVDWQSETSYLFYNPLWTKYVVDRIQDLIPLLENTTSTLWMMTSGSQSFPKSIGLSKAGFLKAAASVVQKFKFQEKEIWLKNLPDYHVGGLSILARAHLAKQSVVELSEWSPVDFYKTLSTQKIHWVSLVPTQIYDLVQHDFKAPSSLRGVFVGGGELRPELYHSALILGWPLLPTYGMTEACSQVATASLQSLNDRKPARLEILDHVQVHIGENARVGLQGESVTRSGYEWREGAWVAMPMQDEQGIYWTQDCGEVENNKYFTILGRADDMKKIRGELVSLSQLQGRLDQVLLELRRNLGPVIHFLPDARTGYSVNLVAEVEQWRGLDDVKTKFIERCAPYERIEHVYVVAKIPRSDLGKIKRGELSELLSSGTSF